MQNEQNEKKRLYFYALICYDVVSGLAMIRLFDSIHQNDKPKIMGAGIWLVLSFAAFICFLFLYKKHTKNDFN